MITACRSRWRSNSSWGGDFRLINHGWPFPVGRPKGRLLLNSGTWPRRLHRPLRGPTLFTLNCIRASDLHRHTATRPQRRDGWAPPSSRNSHEFNPSYQILVFEIIDPTFGHLLLSLVNRPLSRDMAPYMNTKGFVQGTVKAGKKQRKGKKEKE